MKFETKIEDEDDCFMTWDDFLASCRFNAFTDDDGFGELARLSADGTSYDVSDVRISPSEVVRRGYERPGWATHVSWYNK